MYGLKTFFCYNTSYWPRLSLIYRITQLLAYNYKAIKENLDPNKEKDDKIIIGYIFEY